MPAARRSPRPPMRSARPRRAPSPGCPPVRGRPVPLLAADEAEDDDGCELDPVAPDVPADEPVDGACEVVPDPLELRFDPELEWCWFASGSWYWLSPAL